MFWRDGEHLITWDAGDGAINLWEIARQRRLSTAAISGLDAVALSPDGRTLAGGVEQLVYLWDLPTLKPSRTTLRGNAGSVVSLAFSPDGKTLAAGSNEGSVKLWNAATWKEITTFHPHISYVRALAFSPEPESRYFASGSIDDTIKLWTAPTFAEIDTRPQ